MEAENDEAKLQRCANFEC